MGRLGELRDGCERDRLVPERSPIWLLARDFRGGRLLDSEERAPAGEATLEVRKESR